MASSIEYAMICAVDAVEPNQFIQRKKPNSYDCTLLSMPELQLPHCPLPPRLLFGAYAKCIGRGQPFARGERLRSC